MTQSRGLRRRLSAGEVARLWAEWKVGHGASAIASALGAPLPSVHGTLARHGGIAPPARTRSPRVLRLAEREEISRGLAAEESPAAIARRLGRARSTISREIRRHGTPETYRAEHADAAAWASARRPKRCRLAQHARLRAVVAEQLRADWAPQQIAAWLVSEYPDDPTMRVSHETIYRTLYVQARGALKKELVAHLRRRRPMRRNRHASNAGQGRGQIVDAVSISERPPGVEDRALPGHWEGDLWPGRRTRISERSSSATRAMCIWSKSPARTRQASSTR